MEDISAEVKEISMTDRINFAESTIGRMLKNVKKRIYTKLTVQETVLLLELVGFAIQQMRTVVEEEVAEATKDNEQPIQ